MTKSQIRKEIRLFVRDIVPSLSGRFTTQQLQTLFRSLYNNNEVYDTIGTTSVIGDKMVRLECTRFINRLNGGYKECRGVYVFCWHIGQPIKVSNL